MNYYFRLQLLRLDRKVRELGIHPWVALILGAAAAILAGFLLFAKVTYAHWVIFGMGLASLWSLSQQGKTTHLRDLHSVEDFRKIRAVESFIVSLPFAIILSIHHHFAEAIGILLLSIAFVFVTNQIRLNRTIPTPFKFFPWEFILGFRKTMVGIAFAYFLCIKGMQVDNFNLCVFALLLVFLISMAFYIEPENGYFVWLYKDGPQRFLARKAKYAQICISILTILPMVGMIVCFSEWWMYTLATYVIGSVLLGSAILSKYAAYPGKVSIPQAIIYGLSISVPVLLPFTLWMFYKSSIKQLKSILS